MTTTRPVTLCSENLPLLVTASVDASSVYVNADHLDNDSDSPVVHSLLSTQTTAMVANGKRPGAMVSETVKSETSQAQVSVLNELLSAVVVTAEKE